MSWGDPTDNKFNSVSAYSQKWLPTCKAFPKETTCIAFWFTQNCKVCNCNSTTALQEVQML